MRNRVNAFLLCSAVAALHVLVPMAASAKPDGEDPAPRTLQEAEDRWVPSLAITGGAAIQDQKGFADSSTEEPPGSLPVPLRGPVKGDDLVIAPFVGGTLELMSPALPIPMRPRLFVSGEILPSFASDRKVALEGDPGCIRGPEVDAPCASKEDGSRLNPFGEQAANGQGTDVTATIKTLLYGANIGVAFPFALGNRRLLIKPSFGWINFEVEATGTVVDATCNPIERCTDITSPFGFVREGNLRETTLTAQDSQRFNGIGPGLDIEVDTGRFGPIGTSLFMGGRAYRILGDRDFNFGAAASFPPLPPAPPAVNPIPAADSAARFGVKVDPWMFRAHVGIRFMWLGSPN